MIMTVLTARQVKDLITKTQDRYMAIQHEQWDAAKHRYRKTETAMWEQATQEAVPLAEWREIIRVLAQGWDYFGGKF